MKLVCTYKWKHWRLYKENVDFISALSIASFSNIFSVSSTDGTIYIWSLTDSTHRSVSLKDHIGNVHTMIFHDHLQTMFSGGNDLVIRLWDIKYNKVICKYKGHFNTITYLMIHPTLNLLFSCSEDHTIKIWDFRIQKEIFTLRDHTKKVTGIISKITYPHIITGSLDRTLRFWDLSIMKCVYTIRKHKDGILKLISDPYNFSFISMSRKYIIQWNYNGIILNVIVNKKKTNQNLDINEEGELMVNFFSNWIWIVNIKNLTWISFKIKFSKNISFLQNAISIMNFNKTGNRLFFVEKNNHIHVFVKKWANII